MKLKTKDLVNIALLSALAYIVMLVIHIKMFDFLSLEFKSVVITIAGYIYGPLATVAISFVVAIIEMFTVSTTGIIGFVMNFLSSVSFSTVAVLVYKKKHSLNGAILGLVFGSILTIIAMILMNLVLTPIYTGMTTQEVAGMIVPILLPFNIIKAVINSAIIMLVYKPLIKALRAVGLLKAKEETQSTNKFVSIVSIILIILMVLLVLKINGII